MIGCYLGYVDSNLPYLNKNSVRQFKTNVFKSAVAMGVLGFVAPVDNLAHLGGAVGGYFYGRGRCRRLGGRVKFRFG